jgi:hypothetical protein
MEGLISHQRPPMCRGDAMLPWRRQDVNPALSGPLRDSTTTDV